MALKVKVKVKKEETSSTRDTTVAATTCSPSLSPCAPCVKAASASPSTTQLCLGCKRPLPLRRVKRSVTTRGRHEEKEQVTPSEQLDSAAENTNVAAVHAADADGAYPKSNGAAGSSKDTKGFFKNTLCKKCTGLYKCNLYCQGCNETQLIGGEPRPWTSCSYCDRWFHYSCAYGSLANFENLRNHEFACYECRQVRRKCKVVDVIAKSLRYVDEDSCEKLKNKWWSLPDTIRKEKDAVVGFAYSRDIPTEQLFKWDTCTHPFERPSKKDLDNMKLVGNEVEILWDRPRKWFKGKIAYYNTQSGKHNVIYDDGDVKDEALGATKTEYKLLGMLEPKEFFPAGASGKKTVTGATASSVSRGGQLEKGAASRKKVRSIMNLHPNREMHSPSPYRGRAPGTGNANRSGNGNGSASRRLEMTTARSPVKGWKSHGIVKKKRNIASMFESHGEEEGDEGQESSTRKLQKAYEHFRSLFARSDKENVEKMFEELFTDYHTIFFQKSGGEVGWGDEKKNKLEGKQLGTKKQKADPNQHVLESLTSDLIVSDLLESLADVPKTCLVLYTLRQFTFYKGDEHYYVLPAVVMSLQSHPMEPIRRAVKKLLSESPGLNACLHNIPHDKQKKYRGLRNEGRMAVQSVWKEEKVLQLTLSVNNDNDDDTVDKQQQLIVNHIQGIWNSNFQDHRQQRAYIDVVEGLLQPKTKNDKDGNKDDCGNDNDNDNKLVSVSFSFT